MKSIIIYEITINKKNELSFNKKWDKEIKKRIKEFVDNGHTSSEASKIINQIYYPKTLWKYNQIIGYITISISKQDVIFDLYKSINKRYIYKSSKKHFIINQNLNGVHFNIVDRDNIFIKSKIKEFLELIYKTSLSKYYLDYTTFNNTIDFLDIKKIVNSL